PLLIRFPILFAFLAVFRERAKYDFTDPAFYKAINKAFLWIPNLELPDTILWGLLLLAGFTTYILGKAITLLNADAQTQSIQKMMSYFFPIMIFFTARSFPAGLALYWVISNLFTAVQYSISNRSTGKIKEEK